MMSAVQKAILHQTWSPFSSVSNSCFSQRKLKSRTRTCDILFSYSSSLQLLSSRDSCCVGSGFYLISYTQWIYFMCICPVLPWTCVSFQNILSSYPQQIGTVSIFFFFFFFSLFCFVNVLNCFKENWHLMREVHSQASRIPCTVRTGNTRETGNKPFTSRHKQLLASEV